MYHKLYLTLSLLSYLPSTQAQWLVNTSANYEFNDNLSNAQLADDIKSDSAFRASLSTGRYWQLTNFTGLTVTADLGGKAYLHFSSLNNVFYGASTVLHHKFGLGETVPWLSVSGSVLHHHFENSQRNAWYYTGAVSLGKRLNERWELYAKYQYETRHADHIINIPGLTTEMQHAYEEEHEEEHEVYPPILGDAFNTTAHRISLTGIYTMTDNLTVYLSYTRREGNVTSTTLRNLDIFSISNAITEDSTFGNNRYAYRLNASSNIVSVGLSWALNGHSSLNISYERMESSAGHGINYSNNGGYLTLLYNF